MRTELRPRSARARRSEALAVLAGAAVVLAVALAIRGATSSEDPSRSRPTTTTRDSARTRRTPSLPTPLQSARSRPGAVQAATHYLTTLSAAAVSSGAHARQVVDAIASGSVRTTLERSLPRLAAGVTARLRGSRTADVFDGWPLGYRLESFSGSHATVAVWHLDVAASSTLGVMTAQYTTTTYDLRWMGGLWRVDRVTSVPGPTPPSSRVSAPEIDEFAGEVDALTRYHDVP